MLTNNTTNKKRRNFSPLPLVLSAVLFFTQGFALSFAQAIDGNGFSSLIVCKDGIVEGTGVIVANDTINFTTTPIQIIGLTNIISVACGGGFHALALKKDSTLWVWGSNQYGQLGLGDTLTKYNPIQLFGLRGIVAIAAGNDCSFAVKSDGTLWAWGRNRGAQLGDSTTIDKHIPIKIKTLSGIVSVATFSEHTLALTKDGTIWAWGKNNAGQLGDGTQTFRFSPVQVKGLTGVKAIAVGQDHSMALKNDGTVWVWGNNNLFQFGDTSLGYFRTTPGQVGGLTGVLALAAGNSHSLILKNDSTVWGWGLNNAGQLGIGNTNTVQKTPIQTKGLTSVIVLAAGQMHSLAIKKDGTVWAWGDGQYGELGDSSKTNRSSPVQMRTTCNSGSGIQAIQEPPAVRVFPNPSTGKFSIDFPSNETINIQVYNIMGAMILQQQNTNEIDLSGAAKGLYLVKIYAGSKIYNTKVLIQ